MRYRAYQLTIDSQIPLLGFPPGPVEGQADVEVRLGPLPRPISTTPWKVTDSEVSLWIPGIGGFSARHGREIIIAALRGVKVARLSLFLHSSMWAAVMMQRGCFPLHASCLDSPQGAVLLVGGVGVGKSTLATALQYNGFTLISDEMSVLRLIDGGVEVLPSLPEVRLWGKSLRAFGVPREAWGDPVRPPFPKFALPSLTWCNEARSPRALFFLSQSANPAALLHPLSAQQALGRVGSMLYRSRFLAHMPALHGRLGEALTALVEGASSDSLEFPKNLAMVPELCDRVKERLSTPSPPAKLAAPFHFAAKAPGPGKNGLALLAGYPQSGNGRIQGLLTAFQARSESRLLLRHSLDEALGMESDYLGPQEILECRSLLHTVEASTLEGTTFLQTQDRCSRGRGGRLLYPAEALAGVVYVVRSPLDVVLSAAAHFRLPLPAAIRMMNAEGPWAHPRMGDTGTLLPQFSGSWSEHLTGWLDESSYRCLTVRYEDVLRDTLGQLKRIVEFFDLPWDIERGRQAVRQSGLDKEEHGKILRAKAMAMRAFFRKEPPVGWRKFLPPPLARQIIEAHGTAMRRMGYGDEVDEVARLPN